MNNEASRLEAIATHFSSQKGFNGRLTLYRLQSMIPFFRGRNCLELGCADGQMTRHLVRHFDEVYAVDGSERFIAAVRTTIPQAKAFASLFEEFQPNRTFDTVVLAHVLEHVQDPIEILRKAKSWVASGGCLLITVPNAESIHRRIGVIMGMLGRLTDLNEADVSVGHRRVYSAATLAEDLAQAGLRITHREGVFFKPLSNAQIEAAWNTELMDAFYELGKQFPDLCAELLVVAEPADRRGEAT